ncbi:MAG: arginyltransferase [Helicobacteraceae bacterium]|jgi:arginine-tRNA-protein transferase|nr:arginyltransferase [Helicobacteraceae bacterium]
MFRELSGETFISRDKPCPYLGGRSCATQYRFGGVGDLLYGELLQRGWRRFGRLFFRPACAACSECKSVRIDPNSFVWNRSFRRVLKKCERIKLKVGHPAICDKRLDLYERYHKERAISRGWEAESSDPDEYDYAFLESDGNYAYEFDYYYLDRLVCVALVDILRVGVSAVYCYYEPEMPSFSLGVNSILQQTLFAKEHGYKRLYLGYFVSGAKSLTYKARFKPYEVLLERPSLNQTPKWISGYALI